MLRVARLVLYTVASVVVVVAPWSQGWAANCGDTAGDGGARVECSCGDTVITDTILESMDPVVDEGPCSGTALAIVERSVVLDCDGLTITGPGTGNEDLPGILIDANRVTVLRCTVENFGAGIDTADGVGKLLIQGNTLQGNVKGIRGGEPLLNSRVLYNTASNNTKFGIQLKNGPVGNLIEGNTTQNNGRTGIQLNQRAKNNKIILNYVSGDGSRGGIRVDSSSSNNVIRDNSVDGGVYGIGFNAETENNLVHRNVITGATLAGIWFNGPGVRNTARENLITTNAGEGIRIEDQADRHQLKDNVVRDNGGVGIKVCGADNRLRRNTAYGNADFDYCIVADSGNRVAASNQGGAFNLDCPTSGDQCENLGQDDEAGDVVEE